MIKQPDFSNKLLYGPANTFFQKFLGYFYYYVDLIQQKTSSLLFFFLY